MRSGSTSKPSHQRRHATRSCFVPETQIARFEASAPPYRAVARQRTTSTVLVVEGSPIQTTTMKSRPKLVSCCLDAGEAQIIKDVLGRFPRPRLLVPAHLSTLVLR